MRSASVPTSESARRELAHVVIRQLRWSGIWHLLLGAFFLGTGVLQVVALVALLALDRAAPTGGGWPVWILMACALLAWMGTGGFLVWSGLTSIRLQWSPDAGPEALLACLNTRGWVYVWSVLVVFTWVMSQVFTALVGSG